MAANYYLKVPGVTGSSQADGHAGEIELLSWSWGATSTSGGSGSGFGGAGAKPPTTLHVTKVSDDASPKLFSACASGLRYGQVVMTAEYGAKSMTIEMADVYITSFTTGGRGGDDVRPLESMTLDFDHATSTAP